MYLSKRYKIKKRVLISLYLTEIKIAKCISFFEKLTKNLLNYGIELNLLNLAQTNPQTECATWSFQHPPFPVQGDGDCKEVSHIKGYNKFLEIAVMRDTPRNVQNSESIRNHLKEQVTLFCAWIDYIKPDFVFLWHQFRGLHYLAAEILRHRKIPFGFTHLGCLPETIVFEREGEMGESWVAREYQKFRALPINDDDLEKAKKYTQFVVSNKLDRKPLTREGQLDNLVERIRTDGRKIIFYAGEFERYAGLIPYDENSVRFHSPHYTGTFDALAHLDQMAARNHWTVLFKPHPSDVQTIPDGLNLKHTFLIPGANVFDCIYKCDVTVTILSSISYLSRLHGRPTVMLGLHQISNKRCVYEIEKRKETEPVIAAAIEKGHSPDMENAWQIHIAQLLRYYLYPLAPKVQELVGRGIKDLAGYIVNLVFDN
jgi:hypothetical protein